MRPLVHLQGLDCSPNMTLLRVGCNFSHADFSDADMRGTNMNFMVLENADLEDGIFDETTILRDGTNNGTNWIPETDWGRFTDPQYSDFEGLTCSVEGWAFGRFGCPPINLKGAWN